MSDSGPRMLRMVRYQSVRQDAERIRKWKDQDEYECLARTIHMGDVRTAREALVKWATEEVRKLRGDAYAQPQDYRRLEFVYRELLSKIEGRFQAMSTELGYHSQNVGPEYGQRVEDLRSWAHDYNLTRFFGEGREVIVTGHMGAGKSHLAVLFMEYLLSKVKHPKVHVVTNISGIRDTSGENGDRIHHVSLLSEILRIWTELSDDCLIVLMLDEPEANLRGGSSKSVRTFNDFRYMLRKLRMSKLEIWHTEAEQYKALREEEGEHIVRISKEEKTTFTLRRYWQGEEVKEKIIGVHGLKFLEYAHRGMASIDVDVAMNRLIRHIAKLYRVPDMKRAVAAALEEPRFYMDEFRQELEDEDKEKEQERRDEAILRRMLEDPTPYLTKFGTFEIQEIRRRFRVPHRDARYLGREATRRWKAQQASGEGGDEVKG